MLPLGRLTAVEAIPGRFFFFTVSSEGCVLVYWGSCTKCHRQGDLINSKYSFFSTLEPGVSKIKMPVDSLPGESSLLIVDGCHLLVCSRGRREF